MAYGDRAEVMRILGLTGSRFDTRVDDYLDKASNYIDNELRGHTAVPLSTVPAIITDITNDMAAGMFREDQLGNTGQNIQTDAAVKRAKEALASYVTSQYSGNTSSTGGRRASLFRKVSYTTGDDDGGVNLT